MNEFKFHVNRSFGTEQFTHSATINSDKLSLSDEEIKETLSSMSTAINIEFGEILDREIKEKNESAKRLQDRVEANKNLREAITKINLADILSKYTPEQVDEAFNKLAEENPNVDAVDSNDVTTPVETTPETTEQTNG